VDQHQCMFVQIDQALTKTFHKYKVSD
jgi:hypothetical protein